MFNTFKPGRAVLVRLIFLAIGLLQDDSISNSRSHGFHPVLGFVWFQFFLYLGATLNSKSQ